MLGSYFWGYLVTSLPGGMLAESLGGRNVVGYTMALSAVITALTPIAADISYWCVFAIRIGTGVLAVSNSFSPKFFCCEFYYIDYGIILLFCKNVMFYYQILGSFVSSIASSRFKMVTTS